MLGQLAQAQHTTMGNRSILRHAGACRQGSDRRCLCTKPEPGTWWC